MTIVRVFVKIISIPDDELFFETAVECTATYFVNIYAPAIKWQGGI